MPQSVNRGLEHPVLFDVLGELVESNLDGQRYAETPADLVAEPDAAPDGVQSVLFRAVPAQQAAPDGLAGPVGEGQRYGFYDVLGPTQRDGVLAPVARVHGIGNEKHDAVHRYLGPHDNSQVANVDRSNVGRRLEGVLTSPVG